MIANDCYWQDLSNTMGLPNRKHEMWRYSQISEFVNLDSKSTSINIHNNYPTSLPKFMGDEILLFNGQEWITKSKNIVISQASTKNEKYFELNHAQYKKHLVEKDAFYVWYKANSKSTSIKLNNIKSLVIYIDQINQQQTIPELTVDLDNIKEKFSIFEVQTINISSNIYSIKITNPHADLTYHRLNLNSDTKSISWLNIANGSNSQIYVWKYKQCTNKEYIGVDNIKADATCNLTLISNINQTSHYDLTTQVFHSVANTKSKQLFKCILDDEAKAALTGKIFIDKNCPQTSAHFNSKHTLLSQKAHVFSQPQLEIHTDDVECAHGSSTGALQEEEMFYLTSRGISPEKAQNMLLSAFINDQVLSLESVEEQKFFQGMIL